MSDDVLELLESIEEPTKKGEKRTRKKKSKNPELMGILDELERQGTPMEEKDKEVETEVKQVQQVQEEPKQEVIEPEPPVNKESEPQAQPEPAESDYISIWNKGWTFAASVASVAASTAQKEIDSLRQDPVSSQARRGLSSLGTRLSSVLNTIAPLHGEEHLALYVFSDIVGYPRLPGLVYEAFERVLDQVENGHSLTLTAHLPKNGPRALNAHKGTVAEAERLARAVVEGFRKEHKEETQENQDQNDRESNIYIALQAVLPESSGLCFVVHLVDPNHKIELVTQSQSFPAEWAAWLDGPADLFKDAPADIREYLVDWIESGIAVSAGVLAQRYTALRMGYSES